MPNSDYQVSCESFVHSDAISLFKTMETLKHIILRGEKTKKIVNFHHLAAQCLLQVTFYIKCPLICLMTFVKGRYCSLNTEISNILEFKYAVNILDYKRFSVGRGVDFNIQNTCNLEKNYNHSKSPLVLFVLTFQPIHSTFLL